MHVGKLGLCVCWVSKVSLSKLGLARVRYDIVRVSRTFGEVCSRAI